jgi:hypothetical protein
MVKITVDMSYIMLCAVLLISKYTCFMLHLFFKLFILIYISVF